MAELKNRPTAELQAEYDAGIDVIRAQREKLEPLKQELSRRSNARALILNQVIGGQADALRAAGVPEETIAEAEAYVADEKARKAEARATSVSGFANPVAMGGGR